MTQVALVYDFDGTLAPGNMQEYGLLQALGYDNPRDFWDKCDTFAHDHDAGGILSTLFIYLRECRRVGLRPTHEMFRQFGSKVSYFPGVEDWFERIREFGKQYHLDVHHYINSSGITEMIEGTSIAKEFEQIYACRFLYDEQGEAIWPAVAVDYSNKVQFISKLSKGIVEVSDSKRVNEYVAANQRAIPMDRIIYFGDGETDVPSMRTVREEGGMAIAVYSNENKKQLVKQLLINERVNVVCEADYRENSELDTAVKLILTGIALREKGKHL